MAQKKVDPAYADLRGHVPKYLFKRFRMYAVEHDLNNSEALERLLLERFGPENAVSIEEVEAIQN